MKTHPSYTVIDTVKNSLVRFPKTTDGLVEAIEYCKENNLTSVRFSKNKNHVEIVWKNN